MATKTIDGHQVEVNDEGYMLDSEQWNKNIAIEIAKELFQGFQKLGDLVSAFDALLIQAYSYMITVNITQSEDLIKQAEDLFKIIKATSSIS